MCVWKRILGNKERLAGAIVMSTHNISVVKKSEVHLSGHPLS